MQIQRQVSATEKDIQDIKGAMEVNLKEMKRKLTLQLQNSIHQFKGSYFTDSSSPSTTPPGNESSSNQKTTTGNGLGSQEI